MIKPDWSIDILIPIFNEGDTILKTIRLLKQNVKSLNKIHVLYDFDEDSSVKAIEKSEFYNEISFIKNSGTGPCQAIKSGFENTYADCAIVYPADDFDNTKIIDLMFFEFTGGNEVVVASRFIKGGSMKGCPLIKSILVRLASFSLFYLSSIPVKDASNGFRLFSRKCLDKINIESEHGFTYSIELLVKCHRLNWNISEVPSNWVERSEGVSNFKISKWIKHYIKWYFYGLSTSWLNKKITSNCIK